MHNLTHHHVPVLADPLSQFKATILIIIFSIIFVVGVVGHFTVIWIVLAHKRMRTVTNVLLVNLSISEGTVALLNVPFNAYQIIAERWPFGLVYCKINEGIATLNICVSVFTLLVISIERYMAILHPFKMKVDKTKNIFIITGIWLAAIIVSAPNWIFATIMSIDQSDGTKEIGCEYLWPEGDFEQIFNVFFMMITYTVPLICMTYAYTRIGVTLWRSKSVGIQNENQLSQERARKNAVKMLITVVLVFATCWLPYHVFFILQTTGLVYFMGDYNLMFLIFFVFAMSNTTYNPIIYCCLNARFRTGFKKAFKFLPFVEYDSAEFESRFSSGSKTIPLQKI